jgi:hypothetical protein
MEDAFRLSLKKIYVKDNQVTCWGVEENWNLLLFSSKEG